MKKKVSQILADSGIRFDANETAFTTQQLEFVEEQTYDILYSKLKSAEFVPYDSSLPDWAETWAYEEWDERGMAIIISNYADNLPLVDVLVKKYPQPVFDIGDAYQWTIRDLKVSAQLKRPLDAMRGVAARNAIERKIDVLVAVGDASMNTKGLINNPSVPVATLPNGDWANATNDEILEDLFYVEQAVIQQSDENHEPDTLLLTPEAFSIISTRRLEAGNDLTIKKFFLANCESIKTIARWKKLVGAGAGSTDRLICYQKSPLILKFVIPNPFEQLEPEKRNMVYLVNCIARVGGVCWYRPLGGTYADGT